MTGVRYISLNEAQDILEVDDQKMQELLNHKDFPKVNELFGERMMRLDSLEYFIGMSGYENGSEDL